MIQVGVTRVRRSELSEGHPSAHRVDERKQNHPEESRRYGGGNHRSRADGLVRNPQSHGSSSLGWPPSGRSPRCFALAGRPWSAPAERRENSAHDGDGPARTSHGPAGRGLSPPTVRQFADDGNETAQAHRSSISLSETRRRCHSRDETDEQAVETGATPIARADARLGPAVHRPGSHPTRLNHVVEGASLQTPKSR